MSNPAVIKLARGKVGKSNVWLDDNFGESIHLHIDDYRVDLTVEEFATLYEDLCEILNDMVGIKDLDFKKIDPVYLSLFLWKDLSNITSAKIDNVWLEDMYAPDNNHNRIYKLSESVGVKALSGDPTLSEGFRKSHHVLQTERERMSSILNSIQTNGYPHDGHYIIIYGDDNIIRDGQHRASCLYHLYGNKQVPVLRIYIKKYKSPVIHKLYNSPIFVFKRRLEANYKSYVSRIGRFWKRVKGL